MFLSCRHPLSREWLWCPNYYVVRCESHSSKPYKTQISGRARRLVRVSAEIFRSLLLVPPPALEVVLSGLGQLVLYWQILKPDLCLKLLFKLTNDNILKYFFTLID